MKNLGNRFSCISKFSARHDSSIIFLCCFLVLWFALRGEWAKGDDYIDLGMYQFGNWNFNTAFHALISRDAGAGRPIHVLFNSAIFPYIKNVSDLQLLRLIHMVSLSFLISTVFRRTKNVTDSIFGSFVISASILLLPGTWGLLSYSSTAPFFLVATIGFWAGDAQNISDINQSRVRRHLRLLLIFIGSLICVFTYQPLAMIVLAMPALRFIVTYFDTTRDNLRLQLSAKNLMTVACITISNLLINFVFVRVLFDSARAEGAFDAQGKISYLATTAISRAVASPVALFDSTSSASILLSGVVIGMIASAILLRPGINFWKLTLPLKQKLHMQFSIWLSASLLLPITLLPIALLPENADDFRRYWATNTTSALIVLVITFLIFHEKFSGVISTKVIQASSCLFIVISVLSMSAYFHRTTVQVASREWEAAKCATRQTVRIIENNIELNSGELMNVDYEIGKGDEFGTSSLLRPISGSMLVWLSSHSLELFPDLNPWNISVASVENTSSPWSRKFLDCYATEK